MYLVKNCIHLKPFFLRVKTPGKTLGEPPLEEKKPARRREVEEEKKRKEKNVDSGQYALPAKPKGSAQTSLKPILYPKSTKYSDVWRRPSKLGNSLVLYR